MKAEKLVDVLGDEGVQCALNGRAEDIGAVGGGHEPQERRQPALAVRRRDFGAQLRELQREVARARANLEDATPGQLYGVALYVALACIFSGSGGSIVPASPLASLSAAELSQTLDAVTAAADAHPAQLNLRRDEAGR